MPETETGLLDGGELKFDQYFLQFNVTKKYMQRVLLDLTLSAE